ncbi:hypothetical protein L227DRAFT_34243 [Lentinus tigrinus ALCF2SS1-6]|uniref:Uncharacterized protein n=1 Tax=Lentinus tigrinus ALCF2SS1-6 TaxID=1328759 RepID=A0A5C2SGE1_9APHY|nr:hypothetical protein L227DRAFT_34243 [Lentinus tigrinus ALCF2SS1-6]
MTETSGNVPWKTREDPPATNPTPKQRDSHASHQCSHVSAGGASKRWETFLLHVPRFSAYPQPEREQDSPRRTRLLYHQEQSDAAQSLKSYLSAYLCKLLSPASPFGNIQKPCVLSATPEDKLSFQRHIRLPQTNISEPQEREPHGYHERRARHTTGSSSHISMPPPRNFDELTGRRSRRYLPHPPMTPSNTCLAQP